MTSTSIQFYLEDYLEGLDSLPTELQRNFILMRDLDTRAQAIIKNIDEESKALMTEILENKNGANRKKKVSQINEMFSKAREYGDDKVQLAIQTYELVDKHIRRLDSDLAKFESEIQDRNLSNSRNKTEEAKKGRKKITEAKVTTDKKRKANVVANDVGTSSGKVTGSIARSKKAKKQESLEEIAGDMKAHASDVLDMPVDPNEPTYCLCHQVSYGEMIGCDNPECPIEWFHFACVGLTNKPKGKWFCPKCNQERKKTKS